MENSPIKSVRSVEPVQGNRKSDGSIFQGLRFKGPRHSDFFLTPGQAKTFLSLADEVALILKKLPQLPRYERDKKEK